jgi:hypothetical protein
MKNKYTKQKKQNDKQPKGKAKGLENLSGPAAEIDSICRRKLRDGVIREGVLAGRETEIRQDALIMSLSGFLEARPRYQTAKAVHNHAVMEDEMERCVSYSLAACKKRLAKKLATGNSRHVAIDEFNGGSCEHPSDLKTTEWPLTARVEVVLRAADEAVRSKKISAMNSGLLAMIVSDGMTVEEISDKLNVSTNAIYQQMRRIRKVLSAIVRRLDP